jgi:hypothetical protein
VSRELGPWLVGIGLVIAVLAGWPGRGGCRGSAGCRATSGSKRGGTYVFIPLTSMLLLSVALSVVLALVRRR